MNKKRIVVIGGGAAGFFSAIKAAECHPLAEVSILEKNRTVLNKVRISGGGRCNVTHACFDNKQLSKYYPRGGSFLKALFTKFNTQSTVTWFENEKVNLKTESDGRMFPTTDNSETIALCLEHKARRLGISTRTSFGVKAIRQNPDATGKPLQVHLLSEDILEADAVIITTGGNPSLGGYQWLADLGHNIIPPVPSLFTFNVPASPFLEMAGVSVPNAQVRIAGKKLQQEGALLVTHWGFSGPAILKLSAWAARELAEVNYAFTLLINWIPTENENSVKDFFAKTKKESPKKLIQSNQLWNLPSRLWKKLCELSEIDEQLRWIDISNKQLNKLTEQLLNCPQTVKGKSTFKDEFVTCGGIPLNEVNPQTMESTKTKGVFFAGEVLDIDAVTGGFNFQAAWTTGFIAGSSIG